MFASTISGKSPPEMNPHGLDTLDILRQPLAADFHLDGAESLGEIILGLPQQLVEGEIEIDTAGVARHPRIKSAEKFQSGRRARFALRSHSAMSNADKASTVGPPRPP